MLLQNGLTNGLLPIKEFGGGIRTTRSGWNRMPEMKAHHFTAAWTEKIPNTSTVPYLLPYKVAASSPTPPVVSTAYSDHTMGRGLGRGVASGIG